MTAAAPPRADLATRAEAEKCVDADGQLAGLGVTEVQCGGTGAAAAGLGGDCGRGPAREREADGAGCGARSAVLAGVSADYYARLEQGRECHPSGQVVDALARALHLDTDACWHAYRLAGLVPKPEFPPPLWSTSHRNCSG